MSVKVRVEYEITPIRHLAVQCPECKNWFHGYQISNDKLHDIVDVEYANFNCPKCDCTFNGKVDGMEVEERSYPAVYEGVLEKKVEWI